MQQAAIVVYNTPSTSVYWKLIGEKK